MATSIGVMIGRFFAALGCLAGDIWKSFEASGPCCGLRLDRR